MDELSEEAKKTTHVAISLGSEHSLSAGGSFVCYVQGEGRGGRHTAWPAYGAGELLLGLVRHCRRNQGGPNRAWRNGVDPDALADLLVAQAARKAHNGTLRRRVVEQVRAANVRVDAGIVDDGAAPLHVRQRILGQEEIGVDVGVEGAEPLVPVPNISTLSGRQPRGSQ